MAQRPRIHRFMHPARLAAIFLLLIWVGPVSFEQLDAFHLLPLIGAPERASADTKTLSAGQAILLDPGSKLRLRLRDGTTVQGVFVGRGLLDSTQYAQRFYRNSQWSPFVLGEVLRVSLRDGREIHAPFAGYAELALLLKAPDCELPQRVPFEFVRSIHRADDDRVEPGDLAKAFRKRWLPSADALLLAGSAASVSDPCEGSLRIPAEDIESASMDVQVGPNTAGAVGGGILLGVLVTVVLLSIAVASASHSSGTSCDSPSYTPSLFGRAGLHPNTQPFDRERGCWVGEPLLAAGPWPGDSDSGGSTELPPAAPLAVR